MYSPPLVSVALFFSLLLCSLPLSSSQNSVLPRGSSLSVEKADVLVSPGGTFTCGFHGVGTNAFAFSIWFTAPTERIPVWTASRERPVNGRGSRVTLRRDGGLVLTDADKSVVWSTDTNSAEAATAELLETGNLVVSDAGGGILWQSFGSPTHTLLPTQPLTKTTKLVASLSRATLSPGYYTLYFDNDNVLKMMYDGPEVSSIYWPNPGSNIFDSGRYTYNSSRYAVLDEIGQFRSSDLLGFNASDTGPGIKRRLTLDPDGDLRLYSLSERTGRWRVSWQAMTQVCNVHGQCGKNGICMWTPEPKCACPREYEMTDPANWKKGCKRKVEIACGHPGPWRFVELPYTDFYGYDNGFTSNISFDACRKKCEDDCTCQGFGYKRVGSGVCYPKGLLFNGYTSPNFPGSTYVKLPGRAAGASDSSASTVSEINCSSTRTVTPPSGDQSGRRRGSTVWAYLYGFVSAVGFVEVLFIGAGWCFVRVQQRSQRSIEEGYRMISSHFRKFTYGELKKATGNFKHELGRGGAGAVFKGVLEDKRVVAAKKLDNVMQGAEEFQGEMNLTGRIYHMNLVRVWGFCSEGFHRLLVSEYLEKGSLADVLFDDGGAGAVAPLDWGKRYKVALGTARGLAYLHHECLEWIVHCDIKPENILLDGDFEPKVADFGLAKLSQRGGASAGVHFSRIRGTKGYMAPEWIMNFPITAKVDVYSYGVVLLEIVMGRRLSTAVATAGDKGLDQVEEEVTELKRLAGMVKGKLRDGDGDSWVDGFVDPRLDGQFTRKQAAVMLGLATRCLEDEKNKRPSMDFVAETLLSCDTEADETS